jgi:hypothetical protein
LHELFLHYWFHTRKLQILLHVFAAAHANKRRGYSGRRANKLYRCLRV